MMFFFLKVKCIVSTVDDADGHSPIALTLTRIHS
jgi:hypothetical protein